MKPKPKPVTVAQTISGLSLKVGDKVRFENVPGAPEGVFTVARAYADAEAARSKARHDSIAAGKKRRNLSGKYGRDVCGKRKP